MAISMPIMPPSLHPTIEAFYDKYANGNCKVIWRSKPKKREIEVCGLEPQLP
jgi:hypothetical protein